MPPREAVPQTSRVGQPPIVFAGSYDVENNRLTPTANDEPFTLDFRAVARPRRSLYPTARSASIAIRATVRHSSTENVSGSRTSYSLCSTASVRGMSTDGT